MAEYQRGNIHGGSNEKADGFYHDDTTSQHNAGINKCVKGCNIYFGGTGLTVLISLHISSEDTEEIVN